MCKTPGCSEPVYEGTKYCAEHLMEEVRELDMLYGEYDAVDALQGPMSQEEIELALEESAALTEQGLDYFNRYIAGDR